MLKLKDNRNARIYLAILAVSAVIAYLVIVQKHFPYLGMGISLITFTSLVFVLLKNKSLYTYVFYLLTFLFSFFIFYRANPFLVLLNLTAVLSFGSLMIFSQKEEKIGGFLSFLISPFAILFESINLKSKYTIDLSLIIKQGKDVKKDQWHNVFKSLAITVVVLIIIIPLLSSANPIFARLIADIIRFLNVGVWLEKLFTTNAYLHLVRLLFFLFLAMLLPRLLTYADSTLKISPFLSFKLTRQNLTIPKIVVGAVLAIFFVTQAQLYFASKETLLELGYTHSKYAREVFAQLSIVALIVFGLVYNDKSENRWAKITTFLLVTESLFLNLVALKSVYDYSSNWGFTYKRLYGYATVAWIFGVFSLFLYTYLQRRKNSFLVKNTIAYSGIILLAINVLNFDYLIYHYAKSTTHAGIDHLYLSGLSSDAQSYNKHLQIISKELEENKEGDLRKTDAAWNILWKIESLQNKYSNLDFRTFNFSEYFQYRRSQQLNLDNFRKVLESKIFLAPPVFPLPSIYNEPLQREN